MAAHYPEDFPGEKLFATISADGSAEATGATPVTDRVFLEAHQDHGQTGNPCSSGIKLRSFQNLGYGTRTSPESRAWRSSLLRFGPISGICSLALAIASLMASLGVLAGSDGQSVLLWKVPPSTWIAVFTGIWFVQGQQDHKSLTL